MTSALLTAATLASGLPHVHPLVTSAILGLLGALVSAAALISTALLKILASYMKGDFQTPKHTHPSRGDSDATENLLPKPVVEPAERSYKKVV